MDGIRHIKKPDESVESDEASFDVQTFFQEHSNIFADFARGDGGVSVQSAQEAGLAGTIQTAGIDLKNRKLYFNEDFLAKLTAAERTFVVLHEGGHLKKLLELLSDASMHGGTYAYDRWHGELSKKRRYGLLDNLVADAGINTTVVDYAPVTGGVEDSLYRKHLFKIEDDGDVLDMTSLPKHIQFAQVFPYERSGTGRVAKVSPEVQEKLQELKEHQAGDLYAYITSKDIPESMRILLQRQYLYPIIDELFEEDVQEQDNQQNEQQGESKGGEQSEDSDPKESQDDTQGGDEQDSAQSEGQEDDIQESESGKSVGTDAGNPEDAFKEYYDAHDKVSPDLIGDEDVDKAVQEYIESGGVQGEQKALTDEQVQQQMNDAYAAQEGVSWGDITKYRDFIKSINAIKNPKTNESVRQELKAMVQRIIAERLGERYTPLYDQKEGEVLQSPAEAHIAVQAGEREPRVWQAGEMQERAKDKHGEIEITVVPDRSGSMQNDEPINGKYPRIEGQKEAVMLLLETIADFNKELDEVRADLLGDLRLRSEVYSFGGSDEVEVLKPLSDSLSEKERVHVFKKLDDADGDSTQDYVALEHIRNAITDEQREKIKEGTLKKIIIVTSDGGTSDSSRLQSVLLDLRSMGVIIAAIGITDSGAPVERQYAPDGQVCRDSSQLAVVLADILQGHLEDV